MLLYKHYQHTKKEADGDITTLLLAKNKKGGENSSGSNILFFMAHSTVSTTRNVVSMAAALLLVLATMSSTFRSCQAGGCRHPSELTLSYLLTCVESRVSLNSLLFALFLCRHRLQPVIAAATTRGDVPPLPTL